MVSLKNRTCLCTIQCRCVYLFIQVTGQSPPAPTRGPSVAAQEEEEEEAEGESGEAGGGGAVGGASQAPVSLADMMPKVDISGQIKSSMINELGDKNWKVRGEALQQVCTCTSIVHVCTFVIHLF
jgi:cytoskeleton-associated protein 5